MSYPHSRWKSESTLETNCFTTKINAQWQKTEGHQFFPKDRSESKISVCHTSSGRRPSNRFTLCFTLLLGIQPCLKMMHLLKWIIFKMHFGFTMSKRGRNRSFSSSGPFSWPHSAAAASRQSGKWAALTPISGSSRVIRLRFTALTETWKTHTLLCVCTCVCVHTWEGAQIHTVNV